MLHLACTTRCVIERPAPLPPALRRAVRVSEQHLVRFEREHLYAYDRAGTLLFEQAGTARTVNLTDA